MAERPPEPPRPSAGVRLVEVDELEVSVEKLVAGGDGLARWEGIPLFVPRAAPGDRLRVKISERHPDYGRAEIVEILEPGPGRREPPCPYFERCGGCDLQHLEDELQSELKAAAVVETLRRLGGLELDAPPPVITGAPWGYRLRTQLHTRRRPEPEGGATGRGPQVEVGYYARGTRDLVPVLSCPILVPELETLLPALPDRLEAGGKIPGRLDLAAGDDGAVTSAPVIEGLPHGEIALEVGEHTYGFDARCFFQTHRGLVPRLVEEAVGQWTGETAYDLYAGVGLFTLPLATRYDRVVAVEGDAVAARHARLNARRNRLGNVDVEHHALDSWIDRLPEAADRVIVDPPRGGLSKPVRRTLRRRRPRRLTYVSCHAATLARDLGSLVVAADAPYRLESLVLIDLFPQSGHMEALAQLCV